MKRVICCGGGMAAIWFALCLPESIELLWVLEDDPNQSNSYMAKGGLAVPVSAEDIEVHVQDTLRAGGGRCDEAVVRRIISNAPALFDSLREQGIVFDETPGREGGHQVARIRSIEDRTGMFLVDQLWEKVKQRKNTIFLHGYAAIRLEAEAGIWKAIHLAELATGKCVRLEAAAMVLATGGTGNLFIHPTNGPHANGEGLAMAEEIGAVVKDLEFIQFHPTRLYAPSLNENVLITEAFRGAGAIIRGWEGEDLMQKVHPMGSLAPRDIISQAMFRYMEETGNPYVWLDFSAVDNNHFQTRFPYLYQLAQQHRFMEQRRFPVTPAAHYQCGGLVVNEQASTNISGLYAIGEVACTGLHGANRLASNSLLELFHYGKICADIIAKDEQLGPNHQDETKVLTVSPMMLGHWHHRIQELMWKYYGIIRHQDLMVEGLEQLELLREGVETIKGAELNQRRLLLRLHAATLIAKAALARKESAGCHLVEAE